MDSSCFLKLFVAESGSSELISHVTNSEDRTIFVSVLAAIEVRSAIRRRQLSGDIEQLDADFAIASLQQETRRVIEQPMTEPVLGMAGAIIDLHGLRALDSIQLASALVARNSLPEHGTLTFVASDKKLLQAAVNEGMEIWNPASS